MPNSGIPISRIDSPVTLSDEKKRLYSNAGIHFTEDVPQGSKKYTKISAFLPEKDLLAKLYALPVTDAMRLPYWLRDTELEHTVNKVLMRHMQENPISEDQPFPYGLKPFSHNVNPLVTAEVEQLNSRLRQEFGITAKVGEEIDFVLSPNALPGNERWKEVKDEILRGLDKDMEQAGYAQDAELYEQLKQKKEAVKEFNAREILMYELHERDERTKDILQYSFGQGLVGTGYYDTTNVFELRIKHCDATEIVQNRKDVLQALHEKAVEFGLIFRRTPNYHVNFSFEKDGQNLFDPKHPEFNSTGKKIMEALTRAMYDSYKLMVGVDDSPEGNNATFMASDSRSGNWGRSAFKRFEGRAYGGDYYQNPDLLVPVALAGALYGLSPKDREYYRDNVIEAEVRQHATMHHHAEAYQFHGVVHLLNTTINADGSLDIPESYARGHRKNIAEDICVEKSDEKLLSAKDIITFFKQVRIVDNTIQWPPHTLTLDNQKVYEVTTKDKKSVLINISALEKGVTLGSIEDRVVVKGTLKGKTTPGYNIIETSEIDEDYPDPKHNARLVRLKDSKPLNENCSEGFMAEIAKSVTNEQVRIAQEETHTHKVERQARREMARILKDNRKAAILEAARRHCFIQEVEARSPVNYFSSPKEMRESVSEAVSATLNIQNTPNLRAYQRFKARNQGGNQSPRQG